MPWTIKVETRSEGLVFSHSRSSCRFAQAQLIEVNAHSLFSKWFSESGKLVASLFARIREAVEEDDTLVFVLVDEVGA